MFNDKSNIFSKYLEIIEEAFARKKGSPSQGSGGTSKFGRTTGVKADTSTKPASSPKAEKNRRDFIYNTSIEEAINDGRLLDINSELSDNKDVSNFLKEMDKIGGKHILNNNEGGLVVYWMDYPKVVAFLSDKGNKGANILKSAFIEKMKSDPVWSRKLGFKKFSPKAIEEFSKDQENWWYSMPMKEVEGGTGVRQQGSFLGVRTDDKGRGGKANIMPTGNSGEGLRKRFGPLGVDAPIQAGEGSPDEAPRTPLKGYQPRSKGIGRILAKPSNKPKPKRSKIKKESYEPFIKVIPF